MSSTASWGHAIAIGVRRLAATVAILFCCSASVTAQGLFGDNPLLPQRDTTSILSRGVIRIAVTKFDLPGFRWRNKQGELAGPEVELARHIGRLLKVGVQFREDNPTFDSVIDAIVADRADIGISKLSQTPRRVLRVRFSAPYFTVRQALLFDRLYVGVQAAGQSPETVLRKFTGSLAVISQSSYVEFALRNFGDAQIVEMQSWEDTLLALTSGRAEAVYRDEFEIRRALIAQPSLNVRFGSAALTDQKSLLSVAICASCVRLEGFINYVIAENQVPFTLRDLLGAGG